MPVLSAALSGFAAGTIALQWQSTLPAGAAGIIVIGAVCLAANAVAGRAMPGAGALWVRVVRLIVAGAAAATLGFGIAAWRAELRLADALPEQWEDIDLAIVGVIDDLPHASARGTRFALAIERVLTSGARVPERISLAWYPPLRTNDAKDAVPILRAGERWRLAVRLKRPHGTVNPHGYDLEAWLLDNGLRATGYVRPQGDNTRLAAFAGRATDRVQRARENVRERALRALGDAPYAGVIVALAIGEQRAIPEAQWLVFNRTGITHLISISGLHVTVFAAIAAGAVHGIARRSARLTTLLPAHRLAALIGAIAAFGYVLLAGAQVPAQRTLIMLIVAAIGLWVARPGTARMVWLWALAVVLAFDPWAGLTPGFWLSFGAVGLLLYSGSGRLHSVPVSRSAALLRMLRTATHAQAVVTIGLVPMTLAVFQQVSVIAPVANAIAIPVVTFAVVPLALTAILLPVDMLWRAAHTVFAWLMWPLEALTALPGTTWQQHAPAAWTIPVAMIGVVGLLAPRGVPLRSLGGLWLLPLFLVRPAAPPPGTFRMTVLDVGQGLAVVVQTSEHALLYDTGPRYNDDANAGGRIVAPFLRAAGIRRLSAMIVSHLDSDHSGGARTLLQTVPVDVLASSVPEEHKLFDGVSPKPLRCLAGHAWTWDGVRFRLMHPGMDQYTSARIKTNDLSCVVRIESAHGSALLTGDIEARSETTLLMNGAALRSEVLVVPHHGSRTSSTAAFITAVAPRVAIFTPGYRNRFGHPRP
ncbi:MAG: DNA internalization-related competence protein ComEC/Rec2, partial [Betaproteobacteria bacterium]